MYDDKYAYINELVGKAKQDDKVALFELYEFYKPLILSSIKRCIIKEPHFNLHREDLILDAIFVLHKIIDQYNPDLTYFSYFISTRIDITLFRYLQDKYQKFEYIEEQGRDLDECVDPFNKIDNIIMIHSALDKMSDEVREVLEMYFFDNLDQKECALRLGISQSAFSKRLSKALSLMKIELGEDFLFD